MKYILIISFLLLNLGSKIANPASEFCDKRSGSFLTVIDPTNKGEIGLCTFEKIESRKSLKYSVDEWSFFRYKTAKIKSKAVEYVLKNNKNLLCEKFLGKTFNQNKKQFCIFPDISVVEVDVKGKILNLSNLLSELNN